MPTMDDWEVFPREAAAVAMKAIEQGIALRTDLTFEQEVAEATAIIARARGMVQDQMALGYIPMPEGSRAPAPTKAAVKAVARGAGDYAGEMADKAVDAHRAGRREDRARRPQAATTRRPRPSRRPPAGMKKDDGVTDAEIVDEEPPAWTPPAELGRASDCGRRSGWRAASDRPCHASERRRRSRSGAILVCSRAPAHARLRAVGARPSDRRGSPDPLAPASASGEPALRDQVTTSVSSTSPRSRRP